MHYIYARYLLYPVFLLAALFLLDKIFLLPEVRENFLQPGGMVYYYQRREQIDTLKQDLRDPRSGAAERTLVVLGDSRSMALGEMTLQPLVERQPEFADWRIYNFSGPQAVPACHLYLAEKIFNGRYRPAYVVIGISPDGFNRNSGIMGSPVMNFGVSHEFIERHATHIPARDMDTYNDTRRFALAGIGFSAKTLWIRLRGGYHGDETRAILEEMRSQRESTTPVDSRARFAVAMQAMDLASRETLNDYSLRESPQRHLLDITRGAQYKWTGSMSDQNLREETERIARLYISHFVVSHEQYYFLRRTIQLARLSGARVLLFWPRMNPYLLRAMNATPAIAGIRERVTEIARMEGAQIVDMNDDRVLNCNDFYDASHLSVSCFPEMHRVILSHLTDRPLAGAAVR